MNAIGDDLSDHSRQIAVYKKMVLDKDEIILNLKSQIMARGGRGNDNINVVNNFQPNKRNKSESKNTLPEDYEHVETLKNKLQSANLEIS